MRYTKEYKKGCVELYRQGKWPQTPEGIKPHNFHNNVREWEKLERGHGDKGLAHPIANKHWTPEEKLELVSQVIAGRSSKAVAIEAGISPGMLCNWVRRYKIKGYEGLTNKKPGRPSKEPSMKKHAEAAPLTESEREELIRLRTENDYIKAEIEVIKKEIALREAKWDEQLKARKQRSSANSVKKAIR